ncbi:flagellar hook-basal body complex protein [Sphingomonas sp. MMS24-JH45]
MSFYTSLSGLQAAQTELSTISHNLANVSTNGFKKSRTEFADVMATSITVSPTSQVGSGVLVRADRQQFDQGNMVQSKNGLDLAVSGDGFFAVKPNPDIAKVNYTRNGGFNVQNSGNFIVAEAPTAATFRSIPSTDRARWSPARWRTPSR